MSNHRKIHVVLRNPKPVSVNRMYTPGRNGRKFLSAEGKHFKDSLKKVIARKLLESEYLWTETQDLVYRSGYCTRLRIDLFLETVTNNSWKPGGGTTSKGAPRSPFKRIDGSNYAKIIEDAVSEGTGIDDSCNMTVTIHKAECPDDPRVEVTFEVVPYER